MQLQPDFRCSSLGSLDTGSGREIPVKCHGTDVCHGVLPHNLSTGNRRIPGCSLGRFGLVRFGLVWFGLAERSPANPALLI